MTERHQVVIVGAGPVGMGLAIDLGVKGIDVLVLERGTELHTIPKGQNLTQRTGEHFRAWGVAEGMEAARPIPSSYGAAGVTTYGTILSDWSYDWFRRKDVQEFYGTPNQRIPQYAAEAVLRARAAELPNVELRLGVKVTGLEQDENGVVVEIEGGDPIAADFVVGCDGSRSVTREAAGIGEDYADKQNRMALVVFRSPELHALLERYPGKSYYNALHPRHEGYWQFLGRVDLGNTFFFHAPVPTDATRESFDFARFLYDAVGAEFALELAYVGFWDLRIAIAKTYQAGRVFIAGDAAHSHPPYGGYGVNTGFEDARNLSWKLAAVLEGWAGPELLASYSAERRPVFQSTAEHFIERMIRDDGDFVAQFSPDKDRAAFEAAWAARATSTKADVSKFAPHYAGSPIVAGGGGESGAFADHTHTARPGGHLSPVTLGDGALIYDRFDLRGLTLISAGAEAGDVAAIREAATDRDVPLTVIETGDVPKWEARLILCRADNYIAFAGDGLVRPAGEIIRVAVGYGAASRPS